MNNNLKKVGALKKLMFSEEYDKILIWEDGSWDIACTSYGGEQGGNDPVMIISRVYYANTTKTSAIEAVREIQSRFNLK